MRLADEWLIHVIAIWHHVANILRGTFEDPVEFQSGRTSL